jgi:N-dimethylarginine dimethylaminohydrolase
MTIHTMAPVPGLPDLVFTANAALIYRNRAVMSRFAHPQRRGEEAPNRRWFEENGFEIVELPPGMRFEGGGDALFCGETLFAGYQTRSDATAHQKVAEVLGVRVIPLELTDGRYYHLDACFCPLAPGVATYFPGAFDEYALSALEEHVPTLIAVEPDEAEQFACNSVVVGKAVVTNDGCPKLHERLCRIGYEPHATSIGEFLKAGGCAKCLTLRLDGDEAALWRHDVRNS